MSAIFADVALLPGGWREHVRIEFSSDGRIASVNADTAPEPGDTTLTGKALLPALANLHSHAHQRAMAGLTERRGPGNDNFWSWRQRMYGLLERIEPSDLEAIAAQTYLEMLRAGYASVGEFHYLHHAPDGGLYAAPGEMCGRIAAAAGRTGIGLTLLPVRYAQGGVDGRPVSDAQRRFATTTESFEQIMSNASAAMKTLGADARVGIAPHSVRAVGPADLRDLLIAYPDGPIHIHAAEQRAEIDEFEAVHDARPVAWLLDHMPVDARWCFIHATHLSPQETGRLARSGAVAGLCPITEANLGDGAFVGEPYFRAGGAFGVGSDSNVRISLAEELRTLEYSQRLRDEARAVLADPDDHPGTWLYERAARGGAQALGRGSGQLEPGAQADIMSLRLDALALVGARTAELLDAWIFAASDHDVVADVWAAGRHVLVDGQHPEAQRIEQEFRRTLKALYRDA